MKFEKLVRLISEHLPQAEFVHKHFLKNGFYSTTNPGCAGDVSQLLYFSAIADAHASETSFKRAFRFETNSMVQLLSKFIQNYLPDQSEPEADLRKLQSIEISFNFVRLNFQNATAFAGQDNLQTTETIIRIPGKLLQRLYIEQF